MWLYQDSTIKSLLQIPDGVIGFIYKIEDNNSNKYYIGKKNIHSTRRLQPLKGYKRKRIVTKESDWLKYQSSNNIVKAWISPKKTILKYCYSKKQLTYWENKYLYCLDVLFDDNAMNDNISGKFFKGEPL